MDKEILNVFNEGKNADLPLEEIRGGWCVVNVTCNKGNDSKCNVNTCTSNLTEPVEKPSTE